MELVMNREERAEDRERLTKSREIGCDAGCRLSNGRSLTSQTERQGLFSANIILPRDTGFGSLD
jgi:hypothetical protein